jgi:hypothetical protein
MDTTLRSDERISPSIKWSIYAGVYMFACATVTAVVLSDLLTVLAEVIGLPAAYSMVILASPAFLIGSVVWWTVVEQQDSDTYLRGGLFGLVTALLTGVLWTVRFVSVWGIEMLTADIVPVLVALVLGAAIIAGVFAGLPLMYARRRLNSDPAGKPEPTM